MTDSIIYCYVILVNFISLFSKVVWHYIRTIKNWIKLVIIQVILFKTLLNPIIGRDISYKQLIEVKILIILCTYNNC